MQREPKGQAAAGGMAVAMLNFVYSVRTHAATVKLDLAWITNDQKYA
jgi:hypothetical protein